LLRRCSRCNLEKKLEEFEKNSSKSFGFGCRCKKCAAKRSADYRQRKPEIGLQYTKSDHAKVLNRVACNRYYHKNKEKRSVARKTWAVKNRHVISSHARMRGRRLKQATPDWVSMKDLLQIYSNCPAGQPVDHIVLPKHPLVSGLLVPWNLQYLPALINISKSNKFNGVNP